MMDPLCAERASTGASQWLVHDTEVGMSAGSVLSSDPEEVCCSVGRFAALLQEGPGATITDAGVTNMDSDAVVGGTALGTGASWQAM